MVGFDLSKCQLNAHTLFFKRRGEAFFCSKKALISAAVPSSSRLNEGVAMSRCNSSIASVASVSICVFGSVIGERNEGAAAPGSHFEQMFGRADSDLPHAFLQSSKCVVKFGNHACCDDFSAFKSLIIR